MGGPNLPWHLAAQAIKEVNKAVSEGARLDGGKPSAVSVAAKSLGLNVSTMRSRVHAAALIYGLKPGDDPATFDREQMELQSDDRNLLQQRINQLQGEIRDLSKQTADAAAYKHLIQGCLDYAMKPPAWIGKIPAAKPTFQMRGIPTLMLSDLHADEVVHANQVNGVNEYNREIFKRRLRRVAHTAVDLLTKWYVNPKYDGFVLAFGGDMLSGNIHEELRETNEAPLLQSVMMVADELAAVIELMATTFGRVFIPGVVGNHGRLDRKPRMKNGVYDNVDWLLYQMLARYFKGSKHISFMIPDSFDAYYKVYDYSFLLTHGDAMKGGSGIAGPVTPWALGDFRRRKRQQAIEQPYDTMLFGHWHTTSWGIGNSYFSNGSLKGYDEFAMKQGFGFEPAQQSLFVNHPRMGIIMKQEIYADEVPVREPAQMISVFGG